jgi:hypothetical protein
MKRTQKSWTDELLDGARTEGDAEVDQLVERVLGPDQTFSGVGRLGYHLLLDVADELLEAPELSFVESSRVRQQLNRFPPQLVDYFDPAEAPDWVDEEMLALANRVWEENTLGILSVLYAASLPYCYLMAKGIPSLYKTKRLLEHKYIYQRLYETGLMLDSVMGAGGLKIITDLAEDLDGSVELAPKRYVWGKGFLAARKVRFLHSSMRFMLTRPDLFPSRGNVEDPASLSERLSHETEPWRKEDLGVPVNQEDLAYTLLTFGYIIPIGLERWGCSLSSEEKEAFLHTWKLVGHIMGIKPALLPDNWGEAESLFEAIKRRQAAASQAGTELTEALLRFLEDYLPRLPGINKALPAVLMVDQLGKEEASKILSDERRRGAEGIMVNVIYRAARAMVWSYFLIRNRFFRRFPTAAGFMGEVFHQAGKEFIDSWRDAYQRGPFFVPAGAQAGGKQVDDVGTAFLKQLASWRRRLFYNLAAGIAFLVAAAVAFLLSPLFYLVALHGAGVRSSVGLLLLGLAVLKFGVPAVARRRPQPPASSDKPL